MFYSKTTGGFYDQSIHGSNIPSDAVEITTDEHVALLAGQSTGERIIADANGRPILADPQAPTIEQIRAALDAAVTDWIDGQARAAGFKNAAYIVSYYDSTNATWQAAARAFVPWRDGIWTACIDIVAAVEAGTRPVPTANELIAELQPFVV